MSQLPSVMQSFNGGPFDILNPEPEAIFLTDIVTSLSQINRFTGHTLYPVSVAQHSIVVSMLLEGTGFEMEGLMHDGVEAYTGDVSTPMKRALQAMTFIACGSSFDVVEMVSEPIEIAIAKRFGLLYPRPPCVKVADLEAMHIERRCAMHPPSGVDWGGTAARDNVSIGPMTPAEAAAAFMRRYNELVDRPKGATQ